MDNYNYNLAIRFVSDYNFPIAICNNPKTFEYELMLYEKDFGTYTAWNALVDNINKLYEGDTNAFLDDYYKARESVISHVKESDGYAIFNNSDIPFDRLVEQSTSKIVPKYSKSIYNNENIGKSFVSIDMKNANFQTLKWAGAIRGNTYKDFISQYCTGFVAEYLANSKYSRQVIFGQLNPSRTVKLEKKIVSNLYADIIRTAYNAELMCINSDELILDGSHLSEEDIDVMITEINEYSSINYRVETFTLEGYEYSVVNSDGTVHKIGEFYKRSCDKSGKYKGIPLCYNKMIYNLMNNQEITAIDREFMHDKCRVMMLDDLIINKIQ